MIDISFVIPIYNEEAGLIAFFETIEKIMTKLPKYNYEYVCVDDGSNDQTLAILKQKANSSPNMKVISFSRNYHKEAALTAGIDYASGRCLILIDADLQHPPEVIPEFLTKWRQGYKLVYGVKTNRKSDSLIKRITAYLFYKLYNLIAQINIPRNASDFLLMDRQLIEILKLFKEKNRFMRGLFFNLGFKSIAVEYKINQREAGTTKWHYWKLWNFALDGIISFTIAPLRIWTYLGSVVSFFSFIYAMYILIQKIFWGIAIPGYATIIIFILFFGGIQLISLGIIGEYIGRIFIETKNRPLYIIQEKIGFDEHE